MSTPQRNVLELAKQGNTKAISTLINKSLSSHGISVSDIQIADGTLAIKLKSETNFISKTIVQKIQSSVQKLDIKSVDSVEVIDDVKRTEASNSSSDACHKNIIERDAQKSTNATPEDLSNNKRITVYGSKKEPLFNFKKLTKPRDFLITGGSAGVVIVSLATLMSIGFSSGSGCKVDGQPAYKLFQSFDSKWSDSLELAHNTSRMSLSQPISDLQSIKREVEETEWGQCSQSAATLLAKAMDEKIDGFVKFLDPDSSESSINADFESSEELMQSYNQEYLKLLPRRERISLDREILESRAEVTLRKIDTQQTISLVRNGIFIDKIEDFDDNLKFEPIEGAADSYDFNVIEISESKTIATATAKKKGLSSYAIGIYGKDSNIERIYCKTTKAAKKIDPPEFSGYAWSCSANSKEI
jgi:hypothetical protein